MTDLLSTFSISHEALAALFKVIVIDLVLAGDPAVIIGLAAAGLPRAERTRAFLVGIIAAAVLRIAFAGVAVELLAIVGLSFAGGILLLWVSFKMWRELRATKHGSSSDDIAAAEAEAPRKTFAQAAWQIVAADVSMSLDNVLAVAGAAREHPWALVFGLVLSIVLMGLAANFIARVLHRHRWIAYIGLAIILYVALDMIWRGYWEIHAFAT
jgi:YjbE family integral membrane protein